MKYLVFPFLLFLAGTVNGQDSPDLNTLEAARSGDMEAQFRLGEWYFAHAKEHSNDRTQLLEAARWFAKAGDQGHVEAQYQVAFIYLFHEAGFQEHARDGVTYLEKAAKSGHAKAQNGMGRLILDILNVDRLNPDLKVKEQFDYLDLRPEMAKYWLEMAAREEGYVEPMFNLGWLYSEEILLSGTEARRQAYIWYKKVCTSDDETGLKTGACYFTRSYELDGVEGELDSVISTYAYPSHPEWESAAEGPGGVWYINRSATRSLPSIPERFVLVMLKMNEIRPMYTFDISINNGIEGLMVNCSERIFHKMYILQYLDDERKKFTDYSYEYPDLDKWEEVVPGQYSEMAFKEACR